MPIVDPSYREPNRGGTLVNVPSDSDARTTLSCTERNSALELETFHKKLKNVLGHTYLYTFLDVGEPGAYGILYSWELMDI